MIDPKQLNLGGLEQQNKLPTGLLQAVMMQESAGNPNATSPAGAQGLFQFMPATAKAYGINPFDPHQSAVGAARMYGDLSKQFNGDVPSMLAAYNWGSGNLSKQGMANAPRETQDYIAKILPQVGGGEYTQITPLSNEGVAPVDDIDAEIAALEAELGQQPEGPEDAEIAALEAELGNEQPRSFLGEMGANFTSAVQSGKDLINGNYQDIGHTMPTPRTEALAGKLFPPGSDGTLRSALGQLGNTKPSDFSGALLEKFALTPEGKALLAMGGAIPSWNAAGTALSRYVMPQIEEATGIAPENLQLGAMALSPLGIKATGKVGTLEGRIAKGAIKRGVGGAKTAATGATARTAEQLAEKQAGFADDVSKLYKAVDDDGAVIGESKLGSLISDIDKEVAKKPFIPQLNPKTLAVVNAIKEAVKKGTLKLTDLDQYRRLLSNIKDEDGVSASAARQAIDTFIDSIEQKDLEGGTAGATKSLVKARATAAKAKSFERVSEILIKADGDANKIKSGLTRFLANKKNHRGFSKEELAALKAAARSSGSEKFLKMLGKFGFDFGTSTSPGNAVAPVVGAVFGATHGPVTAGAVPLVGTAARYGQKLMARGKAEKALQTIERRPTTKKKTSEVEFKERYGQSELGRTLAPHADTPIVDYPKTPLQKTATKFGRKVLKPKPIEVTIRPELPGVNLPKVGE